MSSFGVTTTGFLTKTVQDIKSDIENAERAAFGPGVNLTSTSVFGQLNGIIADRISELWQVSAAVYRSYYPASASGDALDNVGSLTGTIRLSSSQSSFTTLETLPVILTGTNGTVIPVNSVLSVVGAGSRFASTVAVTLDTNVARTTSQVIAVNDLRSNSGNTYLATIGGTTDGGAGPSGMGTAIVDGTVTWRFVGVGLYHNSVDPQFKSQDFGPINATAFTLSVIQTPVSGWSNGINRLDAELGRLIETDADFRIRREELLRQAGAATVEAIRSRVGAVQDVTECIVFENTTLVTNADGLPGKSFEVVARGGDPQTIANTIWLYKPAGIQTYGNTGPYTVIDSQGFPQTIYFSRPVVVDMYVAVTVQVDPATFPVDGVAQVKNAIVDLGDTLTIGEDVIILKFRCRPLEVVSGVIDVPVIKIDTIPVPINTNNIVITSRQLAVFDTSRITVTVI